LYYLIVLGLLRAYSAWNIDMNTEPVIPRAQAAADEVLSLDPPADVFMLQELTSVLHEYENGLSSQVAVFRERMSKTHTLHISAEWATTKPYFCAIFTRNALFAANTAPSVTHVPHPGSNMHRGYVLVEGAIPRAGLVAFLTSHMESENPNKALRRAQLAQIATVMRDYGARGAIAIFGGDTNLREAEILGTLVAKKPADELAQRIREKAGNPLPTDKRKISDAYAQAFPGGDDHTHRYTWDMRKNDNLNTDWGEFPPQSRYDRIFLIGPTDRYPVCKKWQLVGKKRLPPVQPGERNVFPSDHWGICADISMPPVHGLEAELRRNQNSSRCDAVVHISDGESGDVETRIAKNIDVSVNDVDNDDGFRAKLSKSKRAKKKAPAMLPAKEAAQKRRKLG
jgi:endonuclease/exonuclease/phosphatase family metal-dependent hydrolase